MAHVPNHSPMSWVPLLSPFYRSRNSGTEMLSHLPKLTELASGRSRTQAQADLLHSPLWQRTKSVLMRGEEEGGEPVLWATSLGLIQVKCQPLQDHERGEQNASLVPTNAPECAPWRAARTETPTQGADGTAGQPHSAGQEDRDREPAEFLAFRLLCPGKGPGLHPGLSTTHHPLLGARSKPHGQFLIPGVLSLFPDSQTLSFKR